MIHMGQTNIHIYIYIKNKHICGNTTQQYNKTYSANKIHMYMYIYL